MNSKKKCPIVFLINSLCEGGAERAMLTLSKQFVKDGHSVTILALSKNNFYTIPKGVEMVYLSKMNDSLLGLIKMFYMPYHAWRLKQYVKKHNVVLVQSYLFRANFVNLLSRILGAKQLIQVVNRSVVSRFWNEGLSGKINLSLIGYLYPRADMIIHISMQMKDDFNKHFFIRKNEKVIYNPYDIKAVLSQSSEAIEDFTFKSHKRYLITVGRLIPLKRFQDVLEALSRLDSDIELILLGDGVERKFLEELAKELLIEKRVHFLGQVENPFKYIKKSDIFISSSAVEGFPNVLIESMLCKTVVISSDCLSGPREILAPKSNISKRLSKGMELNEFGILYAVGDIVALVEASKKILFDNNLLYEYKQRAFIRAKDFSVESIAMEYKEVLCYG
ncbi:Alpha-1,4-N-acetylgalactosamine transferase PglJ [hydrothermal vent metagenome]|uniref:Alpha-1,4-N-acetylgalactosamine transferase PglJ n=1 Tax=hydrothermal vent metagenome TaxID=652676 RepID=A0A1W1D062_9ZZZZ